jgi:succinate dehydrogenase / fumarate reductase iron-sulfur subunit
MVAPTEKAAAPARRTLRVAIRRQSSPGETPRVEHFDVPVEPGANLISVLQAIAANPRTVDGTATTPIAYDSGCLEEVCGSCTMLVNGKVRQACSCLVDQFIDAGDSITIEPMSKFPVVRDLCVDRQRLFDGLKRAKAWVPLDGTYHLGPGPKESPDDQEIRYALSTCMSCGCCLEACPQYNLEADESKWPESFIGAAVISQARLFNTHETGSVLSGERYEVLAGRGGVSDCGNSQNCVQVCPKEIPLTESIAAAGRQVTVQSIKQFFSGR